MPRSVAGKPALGMKADSKWVPARVFTCMVCTPARL